MSHLAIYPVLLFYFLPWEKIRKEWQRRSSEKNLPEEA
jgi:hypothetical protein